MLASLVNNLVYRPPLNRPWIAEGSTFSGVGASSNPGAVRLQAMAEWKVATAAA
jgi:hypothetical protein